MGCVAFREHEVTSSRQLWQVCIKLTELMHMGLLLNIFFPKLQPLKFHDELTLWSVNKFKAFLRIFRLFLFMPRPHYAGQIWKRFCSENASHVSVYNGSARGFLKHNNHRSFWICVWGKLGAGKSRGCGDYIVVEKAQSLHFRIPPVGRVFSKSSIFVTD